MLHTRLDIPAYIPTYMVKLVPFNKELREKYPVAITGHKRNCTCYICGCERLQLWKRDNPELAKLAEEQITKKLYQEQTIIDIVKSNPIAAKVNRTKAITGNPYYKLDHDSIHCAVCGQRLGGLTYRCPIDSKHSDYVYGKMLNNPADPRWNQSPYNKNKFQTRHTTEQGTVIEVSSEEQELKERMHDIENKDELI